MRHRHRLTLKYAPPKIWLFTDRRNDGALERIIAALPRNAGIIFRHYHLAERERRLRFAAIMRLARKRNLPVFLAGDPATARRWGADGFHRLHSRRSAAAGLCHSAPVHDVREISRAARNGAAIYFLSPAYPTQSHPGAPALNHLQLRKLSQTCPGPVFLLGGMTHHHARALRDLKVAGWAAIDGLSGDSQDQNRICVPT